MKDVIAISVPDDERAVAERHLEDAIVPGLGHVDEPESVRVLSVMIHDRLTPADLAPFTALEAIITRSDGYDHLPLEWMAQNGVAGYHLEGYATDSVAQMTLTMLLMLARRVSESMERTRASFDRDGLEGRHLPDLTIGVLGLGRIGARVVELLDLLGVPTIGYDVDPEVAVTGLGHHTRATDIEELLETDGLTVHVPLLGSTKGLIDETWIQRMRPASFIVNTARGPIVDTAAVVAALDAGALSGYAADVLPDEPKAPDRAVLAGRPNVVLTPHIGAHNAGTIAARYAWTARITKAILDGQAAAVDAYRIHG